jgi:hypothetical protein
MIAMNAAARLYEDYQQRLKQLQDKDCLHTEETDWMEEWWAPGHSTGRKVKVCANCNKVMQAKRSCDDCGKEFLEEELQEGDGQTRPIGRRYCVSCSRRETN